MNNLLYLTNPFIKPIIPFLDPQWRIIQAWDSTPGFDKKHTAALATTVWDQVDSNFLSQFPSLKIICHLGIGTDNIDKHYLNENKISLLSQPDAGIHDTAELALSLMLCLARNIIPNDKYTRDNLWVEGKPRQLGTHLYGKQLGLVGLGKIGSKIAYFSQAFGMTIAYTARTQRQTSYKYYQSLDKLAKDSDFLIICCSGGIETHHLINDKTLQNLGSNGYLINISRGSVIDQTALIKALENHTIAGAGLDVYNNEPEIPQELITLNNVVLSPHMGSSTKENLDHMFRMQAQQLNNYVVNYQSDTTTT